MRRPRGPLAIAAAYLVFSLLWIHASDFVVAGLTSDPAVLSRFQTAKGSIFVVVTTLLLFAVLRVYAGRKRRAVAEAQKNLRDKEQLIKELHHRVKNNLQVIISLLRLDETDAVDTLRSRATDRMYAMALVHDNIYRSDFAAEVSVRSYVEDLVGHLASIYGDEEPGDRSGPPVDIRTRLGDDPGTLHIDYAVPCGIFLNEAITNAYKHAFVGRQEAGIRVSFSRSAAPSPRCRLLVVDNGGGFEPGESDGSLGLTLMRSMATQLHGELILSSTEGRTEIGVDFPIEG